MSEIDHDWDKIINEKNKYSLFDKLVLSVILICLGFTTGALFFTMFKPGVLC